MWKRVSDPSPHSILCRDTLLRNMGEYNGPSYYFYPNHSYNFKKLVRAKEKLVHQKPCSIRISSSLSSYQPVVPSLSSFHSALLHMTEDAEYKVGPPSYVCTPRQETSSMISYVFLCIIILLCVWYGYRLQVNWMNYIATCILIFSLMAVVCFTHYFF